MTLKLVTEPLSIVTVATQELPYPVIGLNPILLNVPSVNPIPLEETVKVVVPNPTGPP